ncbi:MAG: hypothetical protein ACTSU6_03865, partial [Candidatus Njordarchaeales archaeon]
YLKTLHSIGVFMKASEILNSFVDNISKQGVQDSFEVIRLSNNIIELRGFISLFLYIKVRSTEPYTWGVTKTRLEHFRRQSKKYCVVLLAGSIEKGYFLSECDIDFYTREIWPLGEDGDYKVKPGKYLERNRLFSSFEEFLGLLENFIAKGKK